MSEETTDESKVRKLLTYETEVRELSDAWAFVMAHIDEFQTPSISIEPMNDLHSDDVTYEVSVWGDVG